MQLISLVFVAFTVTVRSEESFLTASKSVVHEHANIVHDASKRSELTPIGEGAYQSAAAVMERTHSTNTDCEDGKWVDCYKSNGDYMDHDVPEKPRPQLKSKSVAQSIVGAVFCSAVLFATV